MLGAQDLLVLRDDIILYISSLSVEVFMKESMISDGKKFLNDLLKNLIFERTISITEVKNLLKVFAIETALTKKKKLRFNQELTKSNYPKKRKI